MDAQAVVEVACVAEGIVGAREVKFWRRSQQKFSVRLSPKSSPHSPRGFTASSGYTIPPATQAIVEVIEIVSGFCLRLSLKFENRINALFLSIGRVKEVKEGKALKV